MKNERVIIEKIPSIFLGNNCAHVTLPFKDNCTLFSTDIKEEGILFHYNNDYCDDNINKYLLDDRRKQFPCHTIPIYKGINGKFFVNQLLEFNKHYYLISNGKITDIYLIKDEEIAIILIKNVFIPNYLRSIQLSSGELYCIKSLIGFDDYGNIYDGFSGYSDTVRNFIVNGGGILVSEDIDTNINIQIIRIWQSSNPYCFRVKKYQIPTDNYDIDDLKFISQRLEEMRKPKINYIFNHDIDREEIKKANKLVKKRKKY